MKRKSSRSISAHQLRDFDKALTGALHLPQTGDGRPGTEYFVWIEHQNRRESLATGCAKKQEALVRARQLHQMVQTEGWESVLRPNPPSSRIVWSVPTIREPEKSPAPVRRKPGALRVRFEALEPRILFSGSPAPAPEAPPEDRPVTAHEVSVESVGPESAAQEAVPVDGGEQAESGISQPDAAVVSAEGASAVNGDGANFTTSPQAGGDSEETALHPAPAGVTENTGWQGFSDNGQEMETDWSILSGVALSMTESGTSQPGAGPDVMDAMVAPAEDLGGASLEAPGLLMAGDHTVATPGATLTLTQSQVTELARVAADRWQSAGLSEEQVALLKSITYDIRDLDGNRLGVANGMGITIDVDAAGRGWFVDETPFADEEFGTSQSATDLYAYNNEAAAGFDLLTTLMHEQGHILGLLDNYDEQGNLMYGFIQTGERRLAALGQAEGALAGSLQGNDYLTAAFIWKGGDGSVTDSTMWVGGVAPSTMDDLVFAGSGGTVDFSGLPAGMRFNSILITGSGYTLTGNSIELNGGLTANNESGTNTVSLDITLINAQTILNANAASTLNVTGNIHTGELVGSRIQGTSALFFDGAGNTTMSGVIDGKGGVQKLGSGTLTLSGNNSYEGLTEIYQGVLVAAHNHALGNSSTGDTQIQAGAALHLDGSINGPLTITEALAIREGGVGFGEGTDPSSLGALRSIGTATNTWAGNIDLAGGNNLIGVDLGGRLNISGVIANALSSGNRLIKVGEGTLELSGTQANVFRGETRVLQGTLELNKTPGKNAIGGNLIIGDDIEASGTKTVRLLASDQIPMVDYFGVSLTTLQINSTGVFDLNGQDETVGNITLVNGVTDSANILIPTGSTLTLGGASLTVNIGINGSGPASPSASITGAGNLDLGTFFSGSGGGITKTFAVNNTALASVDRDLVIDAAITGTSDVSLTKTGSGVLALRGNNSYAGPTILTDGIVRIGSDSAFGTGLLSIQGNNVIFRAVDASGNDAARTLANEVSIDSTFSVRGTGDLTFTGAATMTASRQINILDPNQVTTFAGGFGEGIYGNLNLDKRGAGTLAFTAAATYSGTTTINSDGGTLLLQDGGTLLNTNAITIADGGTLKLDNSGTANLANRVNDLTGITLSGGEISFVAGTGASSETFGLITANTALSSTITSDTSAGGTASLVFNALTRNAQSTLNFVGLGDAIAATGDNRISFANNPAAMVNGVLPWSRLRGPAGEVDFTTLSSVAEGFGITAFPSADYVTDINLAGATSNVRILAGQTVTLTASRTINSLILEDGATLNGAGFALTVTNVSNQSGLILGDGATVNVGTLTLGNEAYIVTVPGSQATINSTITGAATSITKAGTGKLVLTGENHFAGTMNVNAGTLNIQRSSALGATSGATNVRQDASLELEETSFGSVNVLLETINLTGTGINDGGALRNIAGANSIAGNVALTGVTVDGASFFTTTENRLPGAVLVNTVGGSLNLSGVISGNVELLKFGSGTLEFSGAIGNNTHNVTRVKEGILLLNKEPGLNAASNSNSVTNFFVGDDDGIGAPAIVRWLASDQVPDNINITVGSTGRLDLNGQADVIGALILTVGPNGASQVDLGDSGYLTTNGNIIVHALGTGNPSGARIDGGTLSLQVFGVNAAAGTRTWTVNDAAAGTDLTVTSAIVDGTGLQSVGITKNGFGTLQLAGSTANTLTGTTTVQEGTLELNKTAGVNALSGPLTIGDNNVTNGFAKSDVVRWLQSYQLPDYVALVTVNTNGWMDLNGFNETIGVVDAQDALALNAAAAVSTGAGVLTINGNIAVNNQAQGANLWTPVVGSTLSGNLNLGNVIRTINVNDRAELPVDFTLSANITGTAGVRKTGAGMMLLSGNNTYTGTTYLEAGGITAGTDTALGTGSIYFRHNTGLFGHGGTRTLANAIFTPPSNTEAIILVGNSIVNSVFFGNGGNNLHFTGPVNLAVLNGGRNDFHVGVAGNVEFSGGIGEAFGGQQLFKRGYGSLTLSGVNTYSGSTEIETNGGKIILANQGTLLNTSSILVRENAEFIVDNRSGANLDQRLGDLGTITIRGGQLTLIAAATGTTRETLGNITPDQNSTSSIRSIVAPGADAEWRISSMTAVGSGRFVRFIGEGTELGAATGNRIAFTTAPALTDGIINFAVIENRVAGGPNEGFQFASRRDPSAAVKPFNNLLEVYTAATAPLVAAGTFATTLSGATGSTNVRLSASEAVGAVTTANAVLLANGSIAISGANLTIDSGLLVSNGAGSSISVPTLTLGGADANIFVVEDGDLTVSSIIAGATGSLGKQGTGRFITSGANTFTGVTRINEGAFQARNNLSFGTTAGGVNVNYGATLELANNITVAAETLTINGNGETWLAAMPLRNVSGTNIWQGAVNLAANRTGILVDTGSSLVINGVVGSANTAFNKFGGGTLQFGGSGANTFNQTSYLWEGTLELNKSVANSGIPALANGAELRVGNYYGSDNGATLKLLGNEQIADAGFRVRIMQTGLFDLNGFSESLRGRNDGTVTTDYDALGLEVGSVGSGDVNLNGGTLTLNNNVTTAGLITVRFLNGGIPSAPATISNGTLNLYGPSAGAGARLIRVDDSAAIEDFVISATIADGGAAGTLQKEGDGRLVLSGNNTYSSSTVINRGELVARGNTALGSTVGTTTVNSGFSLLLEATSAAEQQTTVTANGGTFDLTYNGQTASGLSYNDSAANVESALNALSSIGGVGGLVTVQRISYGINASTGLTSTAFIINFGGSLAGNTLPLIVDGANLTGTGSSVSQVNHLTIGENLSINGGGFGGRGALVNLSGNNAITGAVTLAGSSTIGVASGTDLNISGVVGGGAVTLTKLLPGSLTYSGGSANTFTGTTSISEGSLRLNKTANIAAFNGRIEVGNAPGNGGGSQADQLVWLADNQLNANVQLVVEAAGLANLNGKSENITRAGADSLFFRFSPTSSGDLDLAGGTLTLGTGAANTGFVGAGPTGTLSADTPSGRLFDSVGTGSLVLANTVDWSIQVNTLVPREMEVSARITGTGTLRKTNAGALALTNATNSYAATELNSGTLAAGKNTAIAGAINVSGNGNLRALAGGPAVTLANDITLNANLTLTGDADITLSGILTNAAGNRTVTFDTNEGAKATLSGTINLSNDVTSRILTVINRTFNDLAEISALIQNGGGSTAGALTLGATGSNNGTILVSRANTFDGLTTLAGGITRLSHGTALGSATGTTTVNSGATLDVVSGLSTGEVLSLNGVGFNNAGALRVLDGGSNQTTTLTGNITLAGTSWLNVERAGDTLDLGGNTGGQVISGAGGLTKTGAGTLVLNGTADNVYGGTTSVFEGILLLSKSGNAVALGFGGLVVGDDGGAPGGDVVRWDSAVNAGSSGQIRASSSVTVASSGWLDLATNNRSAEVASLAMSTGQAGSAMVSTGTGQLLVNGDLTVNTFGATDGSGPAATIDGSLVVLGLITVNDTLVPSASSDLTITGTLATPTASGGYLPGLRAGRLSGSFDTTTANPGNLGLQLVPFAGETSSAPWGDNTTFVYTGEFYDADGLFSFAESIDDSVLVIIDGLERLRNGTHNVPTTTGSTTNNAAPSGNVTLDFGMGTNNDGWHSIEIRFGNGTGGAGATAQTAGWLANAFGFGVNRTGSASPNGVNDGYVVPFDDGTMTVFRTLASGIGPFGLTKAGAGTLNLEALATIDGTASVNAGTLILSGTQGALGNAGAITVAAGASLVVDNSSAVNLNPGGRIADSATITLNGGEFVHRGHSTDGVTEVVGSIAVNAAANNVGGGSTVIRSVHNGGDLTLSTIAATGLVHGSGATVAFVAEGADLGSASHQILFSGTLPAVSNNTLTWATLDQSSTSGLEFVTHGANGIADAAFVTSLAAATATDNVKLSSAEALGAAKTINALLLNGSGVTTSGAALTVAGGQVINSGGNNLILNDVGFGTAEALWFTAGGSRLTVSGAVSGSGVELKEGDGTLVFDAANTYSGTMTVGDGTFEITRNSSLGTTAGGTTIKSGAALVVNALSGPLNLGNEAITINGTGSNNDGQGALKLINGDATIGTNTTAFTMGSTTAIGVEANRRLTLNATIATQNYAKMGDGTLVLGGSAANAGTGAVSVTAGILELNKTSGAAAAVNGALTINNTFAGTATVRYGSSASADQIGGVTVTVNHGGFLDLATNNKSDGIGALTMTGGTVSTGNGTLTLGGTVTYNVGSQAVINGNLSLGNATRTFTINDGAALNDLVINAVISGGGVSGAIIKGNNAGTLVLNSANTYTNGTTLQGGVLALGNKASLGTGTLTFNTANSTLRAEGMDLTGANAIANTWVHNNAANNVITLGGRRDVSNTFNIQLSGSGTFKSPTVAERHFFQVDDNRVTAILSGNIGGGNDNFVLEKSGIGTLVLGGNNTFDVRDATGTGLTLGTADGINVSGGVLRVAHSNGLGSGETAGGTDIENVNVRGDLGAVLEIDGSAGSVNITGKNIVILHSNQNTTDPNQIFVADRGFLNRSSTEDVHSGALRSIAGTNSITGQIDLRSTSGTATENTRAASAYIGVETGSSLTLNGQIIGSLNDAVSTAANVRALYKVGGGTLQTAGSTANTITSSHIILGGAFELNKGTAGVGGVNAVNGAIFIGDNLGLPGEVVVRLMNHFQIAAGPAMTINATGRLDLNNFNESQNGFTMTVGATGAARITTGTGILSLGGNITVTPRNGITGASDPALILGNLDLGSTTRTFTVNASPSPNDLVILGTISGTGGVTKSGSGRLALLGNNTYTGATTVNSGGQLNIKSNTALGTTAGATTVAAGGALEIQQTTEVQQVVVTGNGGTFKLSFDGADTADLAYNASSATVQAALNGLPTIGGLPQKGSVIVVKSEGFSGGDTITTYTILFQDSLAGADQSQITASNGTVILTGTVPGTAESTQITGGASITVNEALTLSGSGVFNALGSPTAVGTVPLSSGGLRNISGNNILTGNVTIGATNTSIDVASGSTLNIGGAGVLAFGNNLNISKTGTGTLELSGTVSNTITTTRGRLYVNEGTVELNKSGTAIALPLDLIVGDTMGGDNADVVRYKSTAGSNQIGDVVVTVTSSGLLDLNGVSDSINGNIFLEVGADSSGDIATGSSGTLTMTGGTLFVIGEAGSSATTAPATITGNLNLGGAVRTFDVREAGAALAELDVQAIVSNGGITKSGRGTMILSGVNTYASATTVNADSGSLYVNGSTLAGSAFTINAGSILGGTGTINGSVTLTDAGSNHYLGGILAPGMNGTEDLAINGNLTFNGSNRYFQVQINGNTPVSQHDQIDVGGTASVNVSNSILRLQVDPAAVISSGAANAIVLIDKTSTGVVTGTFNLRDEVTGALTALPDGALITVGGQEFEISYNYDVATGTDGSGNDVALIRTATAAAVTATAIEGGALAYTEDDPAKQVTNTLTLASTSGSLTGAVVQIVANFLAGEDLLEVAAASLPLGVTALFDAGTGRLVLSGTATVSAYETALRAVTYRNTNLLRPSLLARTVTFTVADGTTGGQAAQSRDIAVAPLNDAPSVSVNVTSAVNEGSTVTLTGLITDPDAGGSTETLTLDWDDPTGAPDSVFSLGAINALAVNQTVASTGADTTSVLTITSINAATGEIGYRVQHRYTDDGTATGGSSNRTVSVTALDNALATGAGTAAVTVVNVAPTAELSLSAASLNEGGTLTMTGAFTDIGTPDTHTVTVGWDDPNAADSVFILGATSGLSIGNTFTSTGADTSTVLTISSVNPVTGTVTFSVAHLFSDNTLSDVQLTVTDDDSGTFTTAISAVNVLNVAPVAVNDSGPAYTTNEDTILIIPAAGVISNDTDASSLDTLSVTAFTGRSALGANIVLNANGSLSYDPTVSAYLQTLVTGESVQDSFTYTVSDGDGGTSTATVTITVTGQGGIEIDLTKQFPTTFAADPGNDATGDTTVVQMNGTELQIFVNGTLLRTVPASALGANGPHDIIYTGSGDNDSLVLNRLASTNLRHITASTVGGTDAIFLTNAVSIQGNLSLTAETVNFTTSVTTVGSQTYTGAATLGADIILTTTSAAVDFSSTIDGDGVAPRDLTFVLGTGTATVTGAVGGTNALDSFNVNSGNAILQNGITADSGVVGQNATAALTVTGGDVIIGNGDGDFDIGLRASANAKGTVDFSGASSVTIDVSNLRLGIEPTAAAGSAEGDLTLSASGTNTVNATLILMGFTGSGSNTTITSELHLGGGGEQLRSRYLYGGRTKERWQR